MRYTEVVLALAAGTIVSADSTTGTVATDANEGASSTNTASSSQVTRAPIFVPPIFSSDAAAWDSYYQSVESAGYSWLSSAYGPGVGPWAGYRTGDHSGHWGGSDGWGPWGSDNWGPSAWQSNSAWRNGPWTHWWGGSACPGSDWPGWTAGPWSTAAPWTSWAGCTATTTGTNVVSTAVSGVQTEATQYNVQVAEVDSTGGSGTAGSSSTQSVGSQGAAPMKTMAPALAAIGGAVALFL